MMPMHWTYIICPCATPFLAHANTFVPLDTSSLAHPLPSLFSLLSPLTFFSSLFLFLPSSTAVIRLYFTWHPNLDLRERRASFHIGPLLRSLSIVSDFQIFLFGYIFSVMLAAVSQNTSGTGEKFMVHLSVTEWVIFKSRVRKWRYNTVQYCPCGVKMSRK